jgi:hypothetical protein
MPFGEMGNMLCKIFEGKKFNIFMEDPKGVVKIVKKNLPKKKF